MAGGAILADTRDEIDRDRLPGRDGDALPDGDDGMLLRGTLYDINERKQLEARLLAANETLEARLTELREASEIIADARDMRARMAETFPGRNGWDLKHAPGGLVDIEFIAQTLQLVHAPASPGILDTDTVAALEKLRAAGLLAASDTDVLIAGARLQHVQHPPAAGHRAPVPAIAIATAHFGPFVAPGLEVVLQFVFQSRAENPLRELLGFRADVVPDLLLVL